jgi:NitT/TauT family transport system ATP-binding protein
MSSLEFQHIRKIFKTSKKAEIVALDDLSFEVPANSFVAIIGPSGCGKSTLLHIAAGLDTQFEGKFIAPKNTRMACLFQSPRLLPWLTAEQNVAFVRRARGEDRREALTTARQFLKLVGLAGFEQHFPNQLSGGMQQRVALARALTVEPEIMLMDEPFGALDELTARRLRVELLRIYTEFPRTVLFVTHNVTEAAYLADRIIVMSPRPGHVIADVSIDLPRPRDYDDPSVTMVARSVVKQLQLGPE